MDRKSREEAERHLRRVAVRGVFTTAMAREAGFTRGAVRGRIDEGRWKRLVGRSYLDVWDLGPAALRDVRRRAVGGWLTWPNGVVSLRSAARLYDFPVADDNDLHMIVQGRRRRWKGIVPHFVDVAPTDVGRMEPFLVTMRRRTALDCLALLPVVEAEQLMAWVRTRGIVTLEHIESELERRRGRPGVTQLRHLHEITAGGALSELERRLHATLRAAGLTGWEANASIVVGGRIIANVDVLFREHNLIIEADGIAGHRDRAKERQRLNALSLAGFTVLRFTWHQVVEEPEDVLVQIRNALWLAGVRV